MLEKILELLPTRGMEQQDLERAAGLSQGRISKWKRGEGEPSVRQTVRMAQALSVPVAYLVDDTQRSPGETSLSEDELYILATARRLGLSLALDRLLGVTQQSAASRDTSREIVPSGPGVAPASPPASTRGKHGRNSG